LVKLSTWEQDRLIKAVAEYYEEGKISFWKALWSSFLICYTNPTPIDYSDFPLVGQIVGFVDLGNSVDSVTGLSYSSFEAITVNGFKWSIYLDRTV